MPSRRSLYQQREYTTDVHRISQMQVIQEENIAGQSVLFQYVDICLSLLNNMCCLIQDIGRVEAGREHTTRLLPLIAVASENGVSTCDGMQERYQIRGFVQVQMLAGLGQHIVAR
jgi:hypothetical protein